MAPGNFEIRVPKGAGQQVSAALDLIPADRRASWRMHRVEEGESLASVARLFNVASIRLAAANDLKDEPAPGDRLLIPVAYQETAAPIRTAKAVVKGSRTSRTATASRTTPVRHPSGAALAQLKVRSRSLSR
jgi:membrane-bound lytic murein transglycosylase D